MLKKLLALLITSISIYNSAVAQTSYEVVFGDSSKDCTASSVIQLASGNLLALTHCIDSTASSTIYIYQFDAAGLYISRAVIPVSDAHPERMKKSPDGNIFICGSIVDSTGNQDGLLVKLDTLMNIIWTKSFGDVTTNESFYGLDFLPGNGIVCSGYTNNPSGAGNAFYLVTADSSGNMIWSQIYSTHFNSYSDAVVALQDGSMMVSGDRALPSNLYTNTVIHIDSAGNVIWELPMPNPYNNGCKNDLLTSDGDIIITGESATLSNPIFDPVITRIDTAGNIKWSNIYAASAITTDALFDIAEINTQKYIAVGYGGNPVTGSADVIIMQIDSAGNETGRLYIGDTSGLDNGFSVIRAINNQGIYICGSTFRNNKNNGYLIYQALSSIQNVQESSPGKIKAWPNPSSGLVHFSGWNEVNSTIEITDLQGRLIDKFTIKENTLDLSRLINGTYVITFHSATNIISSLINIVH